jgi:hypothetical protein
VNTAFLPPETTAENIPLFLPSSLPPHIFNLPELREIQQLERCLREPQADDALAEIRRQRRIIKGLWQFKRLNISGTGNKPNTRMIRLFKHFDDKTKRAAHTYRTAWDALRVLDPDGLWMSRLKELKDKDISGPGKEIEDTSTTNGRYEPSWIWLMPRVGEMRNGELGMSEEEFNDSMRVEWAKARARMTRWEEELLIVQEEMRRVLVYHQWRALWWEEQSSLRAEGDVAISSGLAGYAHKQAAICRRMAFQCAAHWLPRLKANEIIPPWALEYEDALADDDRGGGNESDEGDEDVDVVDVDIDNIEF